ncbi:MAG: ABC transporter permease [SAR202 cluster bacterium]|nr:ABC transporter permease [SAR202 cluster bacterium]
MTTESRGELFDIGYRRYDGPREGLWRARQTLWTNGIRTALGIGRGMRAKILPLLLLIGVVGPAVITVIIASQSPEAARDALSPPTYYHLVSTFVMIFAAIVAPELICPDRRDRVLHLYLVRPIRPLDYILSRWAAFFAVMLFFVYIGQIIMFAGTLLASGDQWQYIKDYWLDVPKFMVAGLAIAAFYTTLSLAISSFTVRRAYASAFIVGVFIMGAASSGILTGCDESSFDVPEGTPVNCVPITGENGKWFALLDVARAPTHISNMVFDYEDESLTGIYVQDLPSAAPIGWYLLMVVVPGFILVRRYQRISL